MMLLADHIVAFLTVIALPVAGYFGFLRLLARVRRGIPPDRIAMYRNTLLAQWAMVFAIALLWIFTGRSSEEIGLTILYDGSLVAGISVVGVVIAFLIAQLLAVQKAGSATLDRLGQSFGRLSLIVPHNRRELNMFRIVAVSAGISEELVWRGFLIWYLTNFMSLGLAAGISTIGFGLAHAYQGVGQLPKITLVSALFTGLYLLTGSIWLPIVLHAAVDVIQGQTACEVAMRSDGGLRYAERSDDRPDQPDI